MSTSIVPSSTISASACEAGGVVTPRTGSRAAHAPSSRDATTIKTAKDCDCILTNSVVYKGFYMTFAFGDWSQNVDQKTPPRRTFTKPLVCLRAIHHVAGVLDLLESESAHPR